ncbi:MAG: NADP-dependent oxidoreductase [Microbacteriaceae bacterium]
MRAMVIDQTGSADVFRAARLPIPTPIISELLVKVSAAGINPIDAKTRAGGGVSSVIHRYPCILGNDFSGVVVRSPYPAHELQPGDEVYGMVMVPRYDGAYAEYLTVPTMSVAKKPRNLSAAEAAGVPLAALTAWGMVVEVAAAHQGQRILIHAGSGGVGHFAVQFAAHFGAHVISTASTANLQWLTELGAAQAVDYTTTRFEDVVDKVDVVIDLIGNVHDDTGSRSLGVLRPGGLIINAPTGSWPSFLADTEKAGVRGTTFKVSPEGRTLREITALLESGEVRVDIEKVFDLTDVANAHRAIETGHTRGKLVLTV